MSSAKHMKKTIAFLFVASLLNTAFQCDSPTPDDAENSSPCGEPEWLTTIIHSTEQNGLKGEITQYQNNGETVFSVDICKGCADAMTVVYNCAGETKCQFGGIA